MSKIGIFNIFFKRLSEGSLEELEFIVIENPSYYVPWNGGMKNTFYFILTNWICYCQISFCTYYAFSLNQMFDIQEVWKYWPLKDGFRSFSKKFYRTAILWWVDQKTFSRHFFWERLSKYCTVEFTSIFVCWLCQCFFILSQNVFSRFSKKTFFRHFLQNLKFVP